MHFGMLGEWDRKLAGGRGCVLQGDSRTSGEGRDGSNWVFGRMWRWRGHGVKGETKWW